MICQLNNIKFSYGDDVIFDAITLEIKKGELISIVGPSGSGKTTMLRLIGGVLSPSEGEVIVDGRCVNGKRGHVQYMPQRPSLFPWLTVKKNILLGAKLKSRPHEEMVKPMLEKAGLFHVADYYPHQLSGGMQQRVSFMRALLTPGDLMLLDEPFSSLDAFTREDMQNWLLDQWQETNKALIFVTHDLDEAIYLSDKVVVLSKQPAIIKTVIKVDYQRPRKPDLRLSEDFLAIKRQIHEALQSE